MQHAHVERACHHHQHYACHQHGAVDCHHHADVWRSHLARMIAQHEQVLQLLGVFLQQQIYAKHQHKERKQAYEHAHSDDDANNHREEIVSFAAVHLVAAHFVAFGIHIVGDAHVARSVHLHNQAAGRSGAAVAVALIAPLHEFFGHKNGVEAARKAHDAAWQHVAHAVAGEGELQRNHRHHAFAEFGHALCGGKTEVI